MSHDHPTRSVNPTVRRGIIGGRNLLELVHAVLENRIGFIVDIIDVSAILESLFEEYFYGHSFQDEFYMQLAEYRVPTIAINHTRDAIFDAIASQVRLVFGDLRPCYQYSFEFLSNGDVLVVETTPRPFTGKMRLVG